MKSTPSLSLVVPQEVTTRASDVVICGAFAETAASSGHPVRNAEAARDDGLPASVVRALDRLTGRSGWSGKKGQRFATEARDAGTEGGAQVELQGLGDADKFTLRRLDRWMQLAVDRARRNGFSRVHLMLPAHPSLEGAGAAAWLGRSLVAAAYFFDRYLSKAGEEHGIEEVRVVAPAGSAMAEAESLMLAVASGVVECRELANTPGNEATPEWMAERAREMAEELGMTATVLGPDELESRGMGGILAVGIGSSNGPRLVRLDWGHEGPVVALVGKGVTFDTGGISIKPAKDMDEMKYDKCGACTVLGIARSVVELDLPVRLRVYVPLAENMPGSRAYRPGDIVRCYNGKTVEILNTDAEGRMILADALAWASEDEPDLLLEYSTLTGSSVVALGQEAASLYTPDDDLAEGVLECAERTGERLWRMPLWPEFVERMKGDHADLKNSGPRWGGANTAAAFLSEFVDGVDSWAHLDIAGAAYLGHDADEDPGATGYGVAFTVEWLRQRVS